MTTTTTIIACMLALAGCVASSRTTIAVGDAYVLPELTTPTEALSLRIYTAINGALVRTTTNATVRITYTNNTSSDYIGIIQRTTSTEASVAVEPSR